MLLNYNFAVYQQNCVTIMVNMHLYNKLRSNNNLCKLCDKRTFSLFSSLILIVLLISCSFTAIFSGTISFASATPDAYVKDEVELRAAVAAAPTSGGVAYVICLTADITLTGGPLTITGSSSTVKHVTLTSDSAVGFYNLTGANGHDTIHVGNMGKLTINGIGVTHTSNAHGNGISIASSGEFVLDNGLIFGNTADGGAGVNNLGSFVMNNGKIFDNTALVSGGGGVHSIGTFTMYNGEIYDNKFVGSSGGAIVSFGGGGVFIHSGIFTMYGGKISGNTARSGDGLNGVGGGVFIGASGSFTMTSGEIHDNAAQSTGGGVYTSGAFMLNGGKISGNTARDGGGIANSGSFTLLTGEISSNTGTRTGGGVFNINAGTFTMSGGKISDNKCTSNTVGAGGGVYSAGTFTMSGGKISGNTARDGGGVYTSADFALSGVSEVSNNIASNNGGGIWVDIDNLSKISVGPNVVFSNNQASSASSERASIHNTLYADKIHGTAWTAPFTQGYNNFDISYVRYTVDIHDSYASTTGAGRYVPGEIVTIHAGDRTDHLFSGWEITSGNNIVLASKGASTTSFYMSKNNVGITANWVSPGEVSKSVVNNGPFSVNDKVEFEIIYMLPSGDITEFEIVDSWTPATGLTYNTYALKIDDAPVDPTLVTVTPLQADGKVTFEIKPSALIGKQKVSLILTFTLNALVGITNNATVNINTKGVNNTENLYLVSYDKNWPSGTTGSGTVPVDSYVYALNDIATVLDNTGSLAVTGYAFTGWNTLDDGSGIAYQALDTFTIRGNVTLFAQWKQYVEVTFDANVAAGAIVTGPSPISKLVEVGEEYGDLATVARSGYIFRGWATAPSGGVFVTSTTIVINTNDHTLYAQWSQIVDLYDVSYYSHGHTGGTTPVDNNSPYIGGRLVTVLGQGSLIREGYVFLGWSTSRTANTVTHTAGSTFTIWDDVDLFAVWELDPEAKYSVIYKPGEHGTFAEQITNNLRYGDLTPAAPIVTGATGWRFTGWLPTPTDIVTSDATYIAQWTQDSTPSASPSPTASASPSPTASASPSPTTPATSIPTTTPFVDPIEISYDATWAIVNLIFAVLGIILSVVATLFVLLGKKQDNKPKIKQRSLLWLIVIAVLSVVGVVVFLLTQDMSNAMTLVNRWTVVHVILLAVQLFIAMTFLLNRKKA